MEFHEAFDPTRSRGPPWDETPVSALPTLSEAYCSSYLPRAESFSTYYPLELSSSFPQEPSFYGIATGSHYSYHAYELQSQPHKRRRIDTGPQITHPCHHAAPSMTGPRINNPPMTGEHHHGQLPVRAGAPPAAGEQLSSSASPKRKIDLSSLSALLCPCCGFGWSQPDGYQSIPEEPPVYYGPERPYSMEKPPSMHFMATESHNAGLTNMDHRFPPYKDQADDETSPIQDRAVVSPLSDNAETDSYQAFSYYQDRDTKPQMRRQAEHAYLGSDTVHNDNSPPPPFSASLLTPSPLFAPDENTATTTRPNHYTVVPPRGIRNGTFPVSRSDVSRHEQQPNFDILQPNQRGGKRGPFTDPTLREQTAQTRKMGSCIRCRMQRIRCEHNSEEPNGPCLTCKKVVSTKASRFPCLRYKITDVRLYKPGQVPGYEWTRRWTNNVSDPIQKWASPGIKVIRISEGYSNQFLELRVREFVPQEGDKLSRSWSFNGVKKSVELPPYALVNLDEGKFAYDKHIEGSLNQTCNTFAGEPGGLLYRTYMQMLKLCKIQGSNGDERHVRVLLQETFKLWMSVRLTTKSVFIVGDERLGMPEDILDETSPTPGAIPLPPVMGAQLDLILIHHIQTKLRRQVLEKLEKMVSKRKHNTWMITYLVTFVLLHNTSLITAHDAGYARKHEMNRRFAREDKVREYHLGANILLAHFHYCNKGVHPFSDECKDQDLRTLAGLNEEQIQFIHATRSYVRQHKKDWEAIRANGGYEDDYFFVSQLFEENWQPLHTI